MGKKNKPKKIDPRIQALNDDIQNRKNKSAVAATLIPGEDKVTKKRNLLKIIAELFATDLRTNNAISNLIEFHEVNKDLLKEMMSEEDYNKLGFLLIPYYAIAAIKSPFSENEDTDVANLNNRVAVILNAPEQNKLYFEQLANASITYDELTNIFNKYGIVATDLTMAPIQLGMRYSLLSTEMQKTINGTIADPDDIATDSLKSYIETIFNTFKSLSDNANKQKAVHSRLAAAAEAAAAANAAITNSTTEAKALGLRSSGEYKPVSVDDRPAAGEVNTTSSTSSLSSPSSSMSSSASSLSSSKSTSSNTSTLSASSNNISLSDTARANVLSHLSAAVPSASLANQTQSPSVNINHKHHANLINNLLSEDGKINDDAVTALNNYLEKTDKSTASSLLMKLHTFLNSNNTKQRNETGQSLSKEVKLHLSSHFWPKIKPVLIENQLNKVSQLVGLYESQLNNANSISNDDLKDKINLMKINLDNLKKAIESVRDNPDTLLNAEDLATMLSTKSIQSEMASLSESIASHTLSTASAASPKDAPTLSEQYETMLVTVLTKISDMQIEYADHKNILLVLETFEARSAAFATFNPAELTVSDLNKLDELILDLDDIKVAIQQGLEDERSNLNKTEIRKDITDRQAKIKSFVQTHSLDNDVKSAQELANQPARPRADATYQNTTSNTDKNSSNESNSAKANDSGQQSKSTVRSGLQSQSAPQLGSQHNSNETSGIKSTSQSTFENLPSSATNQTSKIASHYTKLSSELINKIGNYEIPATLNNKTPAEILGQEGANILYHGTTESTSAREEFIKALMLVLEDTTNDNYTTPVEAVNATVTLENLFNHPHFDKNHLFKLYKNAVEEERNSREFRDAVFLRATTYQVSPTWNKRMILWVAGPSASGKSFAKNAVLAEASKTMTSDPAKIGNYITSIDGGIERETSQIRQLVLQAALQKGYSGIDGLDRNTKLKTKGKIEQAALVSKNNISLIIPVTFTRGLDKLKKYMKSNDSVNIFSEVVANITNPADPKNVNAATESFKQTVARSGNSRAWSNKYGEPVTQGNRKPVINNLDIGSESKKYGASNFENGLYFSMLAAEKFAKTSPSAPYLKIVNDLIYVTKGTELNWRLATPQDTNVDIIRMTQRQFDAMGDKSVSKETLQEWLSKPHIKKLAEPIIHPTSANSLMKRDIPPEYAAKIRLLNATQTTLSYTASAARLGSKKNNPLRRSSDANSNQNTTTPSSTSSNVLPPSPASEPSSSNAGGYMSKIREKLGRKPGKPTADNTNNNDKLLAYSNAINSLQDNLSNHHFSVYEDSDQSSANIDIYIKVAKSILENSDKSDTDKIYQLDELSSIYSHELNIYQPTIDLPTQLASSSIPENNLSLTTELQELIQKINEGKIAEYAASLASSEKRSNDAAKSKASKLAPPNNNSPSQNANATAKSESPVKPPRSAWKRSQSPATNSDISKAPSAATPLSSSTKPVKQTPVNAKPIASSKTQPPKFKPNAKTQNRAALVGMKYELENIKNHKLNKLSDSPNKAALIEALEVLQMNVGNAIEDKNHDDISTIRKQMENLKISIAHASQQSADNNKLDDSAPASSPASSVADLSSPVSAEHVNKMINIRAGIENLFKDAEAQQAVVVSFPKQDFSDDKKIQLTAMIEKFFTGIKNLEAQYSSIGSDEQLLEKLSRDLQNELFGFKIAFSELLQNEISAVQTAALASAGINYDRLDSNEKSVITGVLNSHSNELLEAKQSLTGVSHTTTKPDATQFAAKLQAFNANKSNIATDIKRALAQQQVAAQAPASAASASPATTSPNKPSLLTRAINAVTGIIPGLQKEESVSNSNSAPQTTASSDVSAAIPPVVDPGAPAAAEVAEPAGSAVVAPAIPASEVAGPAAPVVAEAAAEVAVESEADAPAAPRVAAAQGAPAAGFKGTPSRRNSVDRKLGSESSALDSASALGSASLNPQLDSPLGEMSNSPAPGQSTADLTIQQSASTGSPAPQSRHGINADDYENNPNPRAALPGATLRPAETDEKANPIPLSDEEKLIINLVSKDLSRYLRTAQYYAAKTELAAKSAHGQDDQAKFQALCQKMMSQIRIYQRAIDDGLIKISASNQVKLNQIISQLERAQKMQHKSDNKIAHFSDESFISQVENINEAGIMELLNNQKVPGASLGGLASGKVKEDIKLIQTTAKIAEHNQVRVNTLSIQTKNFLTRKNSQTNVVAIQSSSGSVHKSDFYYHPDQVKRFSKAEYTKWAITVVEDFRAGPDSANPNKISAENPIIIRGKMPPELANQIAIYCELKGYPYENRVTKFEPKNLDVQSMDHFLNANAEKIFGKAEALGLSEKGKTSQAKMLTEEQINSAPPYNKKR